MATIPPSAPGELVEWIEACIAGQPTVPQFDIPEIAADMVDDAAWLLGLAGRLTWCSKSPEGTEWLLSVHAPDVHENEANAVYGLPLLIAPHCQAGTIAAFWTDMAPDVDPDLVFVQDGVMFVGQRNGLPVPAVESDDDEAVVWRLGTETATVEDLARFGVPDPERAARHAEQSGEPVLARHLLARSVGRALRAADLTTLDPDGGPLTEAEHARLRAAASRGAQLTLEVIDAGGDPGVVPDSPGWQLQEVSRGQRLRRRSRSSGRVITHLVEALDQVNRGGADLDAGPRHLTEGETLRALAPLRLKARGPVIWTTTSTGSRSEGTHDLDVEVPPGAQLVVTKVYEKGHAECRPAEGDFLPWIDTGRSHRRQEPAEPVAATEEYALGWIRPEDEGRLFERLDGR